MKDTRFDFGKAAGALLAALIVMLIVGVILSAGILAIVKLWGWIL